MKLRKREKIQPINVVAGDKVVLTYTDVDGVRTTVLDDTIDRAMHLTEAAIFDVENSDFEGVTDGIGGVFLQVDD